MKHFIDRAILFAFFTLIGATHIAVAQCDRINYTDFESDLGAWTDGGIHAYRTSINPYEGSLSMRLRANSGSESSIYSQALDLSQRIKPELDFFYYPESMEAGEQLVVEASYDNGNSYFILTQYVSGTHFENGRWYNATIDLRVLEARPVNLRIRCEASSTTDRVYIDNVAIQECLGGVIAGEDEEEANCSPGTPCDDQNPCTDNDIIDITCNCAGTIVDSDGDTVCDVFDVCPTGNDLIDLNQNGTPDACEENDSDCFTISHVDFEQSNGIWVDGGSGAYLYTGRASNGTKSFRLRGNGGSTSSIFTSALNLSESINPLIQFQYYPESMEPGEQLIVEVSLDSGVSFVKVSELTSGIDFTNYSWQSAAISLKSFGLSSSMIVRIRCVGSSFLDKVYVDEILIEDCPTGGPIASTDCLVNTACNDDNACTENDVWTASCECLGTIADADNDGVCDIDDVCQGSDDRVDSNSNGIPDGCEIADDCLVIEQANFEAGFGNWTDGGVNAEVTSLLSQSGSQSIRLYGNNGSASGMSSARFDLSSTINPEMSFQFYADNFTSGDALDISVSYDAGDSYLPLTTLSFGTDFSNGAWNMATVSLNLFGLDTGMSIQIISRALGTTQSLYVDDVLIQDCSPGLAEVIASACAVGTACDDEDECTINDVFGENCDCAGVVADMDADGVCDARDVCPNGNDTIDNDNNGIPDACDSQVGGCQTISYNDFESDLGIWNLGGNNARHYRYRGLNSSSSVRLTDNNGVASSVYSNVQDLTKYNAPTLEFQYFGLSMEIGEELVVELSTDGGQSFSVIRNLVSGTDFLGPQWNIVSIPLANYNPTSQSIIRLRCNASSTADKIFIDDLAILDCSASEGRNFIVDSYETNEVEINIYPNPTTDYVTIKTQFENNLNASYQVELINVAGQLLYTQKMSAQTQVIRLDMTPFESQQMYFLRTIKDGEIIHNEKLIKI